MLAIQDLSIRFTSYTYGLRKKESCVVRGLDLSIAPGQVMAVIGQSGAGKSLLAHALLGILPRNARVEGRVFFKGQPLTPERLSSIRGREIALIPQSVTALNPLLRVGVQVARAARLSGISKKDVPTNVRHAFARYLLQKEITAWFPFQLSGGMARRVLTATATVGMADLILADEPTSGLDPITASETLGHLRELANTGKAVLLITHDLATALQVADMVTVFCSGTTVEVARADDFQGLCQLRHPYTRALWSALPANGFVGTMQPIEKSSNADGCPFHRCCNDQDAVCSQRVPELKRSGAGW
ncbi:MAG: peptide ABC transporter ATP-binding protein, partial [Deltaproteobacteria bacterium CG23_combo_of_CG06-09_8_20_14_all_60_8]